MVLTKSERRALLFITGILISSVLVQWIIPNETNTKIYDYSMQDSLFKALSADTTEMVRAEEAVIKPLKSTNKIKSMPKGTAHTENKIKSTLREKSININTADQKSLEKLPGIGPATARLIIEYREQNGPFQSIKDLDKVKRIGPKTIDKIAPYIYLENTVENLQQNN